MKVGLALLLSTLCAPVLLAGTDSASPAADGPPQTRAEERRRYRDLKRQDAQTPQRPQVQRALVWFEQQGREKVENFNVHRFFPKFGGLPTGSGFAGGTRYWNPRLRGTPWDFQATALTSVRGYQLLDFQVGQIEQPERPLTFFADVRYRDFPQEDFFGLGPGSSEQARSDYRMEDSFFGATVRYRTHRHVQLEARGGLLRARSRRGTDERFPDAQDVFSPVDVPGLSDRTDYLSWSGSVLLDFRDQPGPAAHEGGSVRFGLTRYDDIDADRFDFTKVETDADYYVPLWSSGRTLALRYFHALDVAGGGHHVPFYLHGTLGGSDMLRGFREYRFRDRNLVYLSAEYRWEAVPALEFAVFHDAGKVFSDRGDYGFTGLQRSTGVGVRIKTRRAVVVRVDAARSREGNRFYFKFGPAF